jgi:prepilin-type N-terminal cleavage/methylation domain-containing protein
MPNDMRQPVESAPPRACTCPRESAFSLVELLVALAVVAILMSIAIATFGGAKSSVRGNEAKSIGTAYAQAISQFQADHANRNPTSAQMSTVDGYSVGPTNLVGKPYMTSLPEGVGTRVGVDMACGSPGGGAFTGWVSYCPEGDGPLFGVRVNTRPKASAPWGPACWLGSTANTPRC